MSTRIGLISDVHSSPVALAEALQIFADEQVDDIICAGDIAGYYDTLIPTIALLSRSDCKTIVGNHDQAWLEKTRRTAKHREIRSYLQQLPQTLELEIEGKRLFVVHANPPSEQHGGIKLRDRDGELVAERNDELDQALADLEHDVLIVGHTHQVYAEQLGGVLVINPGSVAVQPQLHDPVSARSQRQTYALGEREIINCWNFSMLQS